MANAIIESAKERMDKAGDALRRELGNIRAGVANPSILRNITAEYYGADTPLNQLASITVPEARVLLITPFDKTALKGIERSEEHTSELQSRFDLVCRLLLEKKKKKKLKY